MRIEEKEPLVRRRSQLEMYVDILKVLSNNGHLKLTHITHKANVSANAVKEYLDFLIKKKLVEDRTIKNGGEIFILTQQGRIVLKQFQVLAQVLPFVDEDEKK